jgi:hypothetical protein
MRILRSLGERIVDGLPEIGHMTNIEAPESFNAAVRGFLERRRSGAMGSSGSPSADGA